MDNPGSILLHEGLVSVTMCKDFPDKLVAVTACNVFVCSCAGYGKSDPVSLLMPLNYVHFTDLAPLSLMFVYFYTVFFTH